MEERPRNGKLTEFNKPFIEQRADPFICKMVNGKYIFTASVPEYDRIVLRVSDTLDGLKNAEEKVVWRKHDSGLMSCNVWAPEIHYLFGDWYIYFAASDKDDIWAIRPYVLKCTGDDPIRDPWIEMGMMKSAENDEFSFRAFSLDMTVFENNDKWYAVWAEKVSVGKQISNLYIARLKNACELETEQVLLTGPDYDWERHGFWVNEGPGVIEHENKLFLTFSASDTSPAYCIGMLSIDKDDDLLDPRKWEKQRYPVLKTDFSRNIYGPGHNCFTTDDVGNDIMVFHARTTDKLICEDPLYDPNRHTMIIPVMWGNNGYPIFQYA